MGNLVSRVGRAVRRESTQNRPGNEEGDGEQQHTYSNCANERRPYFGSHFMMGGERYELAKPEAFLFGENSDLDLLGDRPVGFPYARHPVTDPVRPLNLFVNIRKESVKFAKSTDEEGNEKYHIEFTFDADFPCYVQIHFNAREFPVENEVQFLYRDQHRPQFSDKYMFEPGPDQVFRHFEFNTSLYDISKMRYTGGSYYPVVIAIHTQGNENKQLQTTMATIDCASDSSHSLILKPLRQKIAFDGVVYMLQEIFGIENKEQNDITDENGFECIICMSELRDTVILPCRHLCLCNGCAETLRYKMNNCPICRSPFRALMQVKALRLVSSVSIADATSTAQPRSQTRYETLTVVEALNGPLNHMQTMNVIGAEDGSDEAGMSREPARIRSGRIRMQKVVGKKGGDEPRESSEGIEMASAEYFLHRPANVVIVKPALEKNIERDDSLGEASQPLTESSSAREGKDTTDEEEDEPANVVVSDPSSSDSHESTNVLLKQ